MHENASARTCVAANRRAAEAALRKAASAAGRDPAEIALCAVSKKQPEPRLQAALDAGQRLFGENRVQEAAGRWAGLKERMPDLRLHLIGPLQTNKAREAVALFDRIETLDREKLAASLARAMDRQGRRIPCCIQVNTGAEPGKSGIAPQVLPEFLARCTETYGLTVDGLMCIPPRTEPAALHFALLARLGARHGLPFLSMGMSGDFETAVRLGATSVRLGTAFFGTRPQTQA